MNARGHHRVAARVLHALGVEAPGEWWSMPPLEVPRLGAGRYTRDHLGPWVRRRLTGTSSGDGRAAKHPFPLLALPNTLLVGARASGGGTRRAHALALQVLT